MPILSQKQTKQKQILKNVASVRMCDRLATFCSIFFLVWIRRVAGYIKDPQIFEQFACQWEQEK